MPAISLSSESELGQVFAGLRECTPKLARLSLAELLAPLDRLAASWQPGTPLFIKARELLGGLFCPAAVERALTSLALGLRADVLAGELHSELGRADLLERWQTDLSGAGLIRGYPLGIVTHILAGNVFLGGVVAMAQSLLTRNPTLLKLSQEDSGFTSLFAESLREADPSGVVSSAVSVCRWDSRQEDLNNLVRLEADGIVVWGGAAAIAAYPAEKCRGRVIHYGPRLGIGVVLEGADLDSCLPALAWDIALWEQRACSSPRIVLVEDRGGTGQLPRAVATGLDKALSLVRGRLPTRPLTLDEKAEVLSLRELAWWSGNAEIHADHHSMDHTVLSVPAIPLEIPVGMRTVLVVPIESCSRLPEVLALLRDHLQTAVLAASGERWSEGIDWLVASGVTQITAPGAASARVVGLPHEGEFALRRLIKLVGIDLGIGPLVDPDRAPLDRQVLGLTIRAAP